MTGASRSQHWNKIYEAKGDEEVSWFAPHLNISLRLIESTGLDPATASVIDVGGGRSTLVDDLLAKGYEKLTILDISSSAIEQTKQRLGDKAAAVTLIAADVTQAALPENEYDLWHDRAVFHFLTDPDERSKYVAQVLRSV